MVFADYLGLASGVGLVLTGLGLAAARPKRRAGWWFAAFVVVWGTETTLFNTLGLVGDLSTVVLLERIAFAVILVEVLFLVHFVVRYTDNLGTRVGWWSTGTAVFTLAVGLALAYDPSLFSERAGPTLLSTLFVNVPKFAAFFVAVGVLARRYRSDLYENVGRELRIVLVGLGLYAAYTAGFHLLFYGSLVDWSNLLGSRVDDLVLLAVFGLGTGYILYLAANLARAGDPVDAGGRRFRGLVPAALAVPVLVGLATAGVEVAGGPIVEIVGLLRIGSALLIGYGLLKFEIFEIDRKVKTGLKSSVVAGSFVLVFFAISETVEFFVGATVGTGAGLAAAGLLTLAFKPIEEGASDLANRVLPGVDDSEAYEERRTVEVYQAAVERAAGDQVLTEREKQILAGLREDLDLAAEEARSIEERFLPQPVAG